MLVFYVQLYGFHLHSSIIHFCLHPHWPIGAIFTFTPEVMTLALM